jgi:tetratricopeptide (TPR) repeat protein
MAELNLISKCRKNSQSECVSILFPEESRLSKSRSSFHIFAAALLCLLALSCAERIELGAPPELKLVDPFEFLNSIPDPEFNKAYANYQQGYYSKSRSQLKKIVDDDATNFPALLTIGYTYVAEKNFSLAEKYVRQALEISPGYPQAHFALALILEQQNNYEGALAELNEVVRLNPDYPDLEQNRNIFTLKATEFYLNKGRTLADGDPAGAIRYFEAAAALAPEIPQIPLQIAEIYLKQKNCTQGMKYLEKAGSEAMPEDFEAQSNLANCYKEAGEAAKALTLYQQLKAQKPDDPELRTKIENVEKILAFESMPEEFQAISSAERVNRAQLAALLVTNLEFLQKYAASHSQIITDTLNHWAHNYIRKVVDLGMMDLFPNRTFQPNRSITKLELARAASRVLEILERNEGRPVPASGQQPELIPDISTGHVYYSMISRAVSAGVVSIDADGSFHPGRPVSGAEAMSMVNRLKMIAE